MWDNARRGHLGIPLHDYRQEAGELLAGMTQIAACNPHAWFQEERTAEFLITTRPDNRMVTYPYTKHMMAIMEVDMAAAVIVASQDAADRLGVPEDKRVYLHGWCLASDPPQPAAHEHMWKSRAIESASTEALRCAGINVDEVKYIDFYSCFSWGCDPDAIAVLLFTSGTTSEPKAAVLRHRNLASYLIGSLEFGAAGEDEAAVVSVPPYHIASVSSVLSTTYTGRRVVQLERFDPHEWVRAVRDESATHAMVVPTMLGRILDVVEADGAGLPSLRSLAYGGGPMPRAVVERAMAFSGDSTWSTPTASRRPRAPPPSSAPTTTAPRSPAPIRPGEPAWHRSARCSPGWSWRFGTRWVSLSPTARSARSGSGATRCRASTWVARVRTRMVGSTPAMPAASMPTASSSCTAGSMT